MRIVKDPVERKNEILDAAEILFTTKGYVETTVIDILKAVGIAKGTFYYYFTSKEEVLDAILVRLVDSDVEKMQAVAKDTTLSPIEKLTGMLLAQQPQPGDTKSRMHEIFHKPGNGDMHQKHNVLALRHLAPIMALAAKEGIEQGIFHLEYPEQTVEFLLGASIYAFDEGLNQWTPEELKTRGIAYVAMMEAAMGAEKGSFSFILQMILENN